MPHPDADADGTTRPASTRHPDAPDTDLTFNELYDLFSSDIRRDILYTLKHDPDARDISDLAATLAHDRDITAEDLKLSLCHVHLPQLQQANLLTFDRDAGTVTKREYDPRVEFLLEFTRQEQADF